MRVTGNTFTNSLATQLNQLTARQYRLQNQAATGQRIHAPEDDPAAMQRTLALRDEQSRIQQFANNITALQDRATDSYNALRGVKKVSDRAGEIATLADDTRSSQELTTYAREISQLIQQAVQTLNAQYRGQYIFGGTASDHPPFTVATDSDGNVTGVTYNGNVTVAQNDIDDSSSVSVDVPGQNSSGTGPRGVVADSRSGADLFAHLISLQNHLRAGDTSAIASTDRPALTKDEDNLLYQISNNGAMQTRLQTAASRASERLLSLEQSISKEADADLTSTLVELSQAQNAYQAALQSGAMLMSTSLLDYIR